MQTLWARDRRETPWKNGGGTTTEIAAFPPGSSLEDFAWRVSLARVQGPGPFSRFAGVDRSIALVEGQGMTLAIAGRGEVSLDEATAPLAFPGDVDFEATVVAGSSLDLNVMTRRGRFRHFLTRLGAAGAVRVVPLGETALVVVLRGAVRTPGADEIGPLDAVLLEGGETLDATFAPRTACLVVDLWRWTTPPP
jgi:environmental stress-induced protein Ves